MTIRAKLKVNILKMLLHADGSPITQEEIIDGCQTVYRDTPINEILVALKELQMDYLVIGARDAVTNVLSLGLTTRGTMEASKL